MIKRLSFVIALLCAVAAYSAAGAFSKTTAKTHAALPYTVGIADELPAMFTDPRFKALGIRHVRYDLEWDALQNARVAMQADAYMKAAKKAGVDVLITFDHTRIPGGSNNPTPAELVTAMRKMHTKWPWVKAFSTWNEVNLAKKGDVIAKWWMALNKAKCIGCTVLGADLVDRAPGGASPAKVKKSFDTFFTAFFKATKGKQPAVWGLHNYIDANTFTTTGTKLMLADVKGKIWFTETGGLVSRHSASTIKLKQGQSHATQATKYLFQTLARLDPRIQRVYDYEWTRSGTTWDSAFTGPKDETRPTLTFLATLLGKKLPTILFPTPTVPTAKR